MHQFVDQADEKTKKQYKQVMKITAVQVCQHHQVRHQVPDNYKSLTTNLQPNTEYENI